MTKRNNKTARQRRHSRKDGRGSGLTLCQRESSGRALATGIVVGFDDDYFLLDPRIRGDDGAGAPFAGMAARMRRSSDESVAGMTARSAVCGDSGADAPFAGS